MEALLATWSPIAIISFALSPIFISLCALGAAIWSGIAQRKHNQLSVRPALEFLISIEKFQLKNSGLGPARVGVVAATVDGDKVFDFHSPEATAECVLELFPDADSGCESFGHITDAHLPPGEEFDLITFDSKVTGRQLRQALGRLEIKAQYRSMYDEQMEPASWFGGFRSLDQPNQ